MRLVMAEDAAGLGCIGLAPALGGEMTGEQRHGCCRTEKAQLRAPLQDVEVAVHLRKAEARRRAARLIGRQELGRPTCRERVCQTVSISVVSVSFTKKKLQKLDHY